jgi:S-adenosylmethionine decarboxylase
MDLIFEEPPCYEHDLDPDVMRQFFKTPSFESIERVSHDSGISLILPGSRIDAHMFDPCGYSMNGMYRVEFIEIHCDVE